MAEGADGTLTATLAPSKVIITADSYISLQTQASGAATAAGTALTTATQAAAAAAQAQTSANEAASRATAAQNTASSAQSAASAAQTAAGAAQTDAATALQRANAALSTASAAGSSALPFFANEAAAKAGGVPRFALYRYSNQANGFAMRIGSDVMEYYYTPYPAALSVQAVPMQNAANWTMEGWYYFSQAISVYALMQLVDGANSCSLQTNGGGQFELVYNLNGNYQRTVPINYGTSPAPENGVWFHLAVVKNGSTVTLYYKGALLFSVAIPSGQTWVFSNSSAFSVGRTLPVGDGYNWQGKVSWTNSRVSREALYTANFAPAFPCEEQYYTAVLLKGDPPMSMGVTPQITGPAGTTMQFASRLMPALGTFIP